MRNLDEDGVVLPTLSLDEQQQNQGVCFGERHRSYVRGWRLLDFAVGPVAQG